MAAVLHKKNLVVKQQMSLKFSILAKKTSVTFQTGGKNDNTVCHVGVPLEMDKNISALQQGVFNWVRVEACDKWYSSEINAGPIIFDIHNNKLYENVQGVVCKFAHDPKIGDMKIVEELPNEL